MHAIVAVAMLLREARRRSELHLLDGTAPATPASA
jgi:hypothetical protein